MKSWWFSGLEGMSLWLFSILPRNLKEKKRKKSKRLKTMAQTTKEKQHNMLSIIKLFNHVIYARKQINEK